jgi:hypothetical protein
MGTLLCQPGSLAMAFRPPVPRELFNNYWEQSKARTLAALAATRVQAFEANGPHLRRKWFYAQLSLISLVSGVPLMAASLIVAAGHHT